MSNMQNNSSNVFFPTETNPPFGQQHNSTSMRIKNTSSYSSILFKTKQSSKQRLVTPQLQSIIDKIQVFVEVTFDLHQDIDSKIQNRVQLVKQVYLNEYKEQVVEMSTQLKNLREKLDNQVMKEKANEKMFYLEEQRDFFRHQVIKLNEQMNKLNEENKQIKKILDQQKRQLANYKQVVYNLQSKVLKLKTFNIEKNKMFQTGQNMEKTKKQPSTIDTKKFSGSKTERTFEKPMQSLETIQDEQSREMSNTGYRLRGSQSMKAYPKLSTPQREIMRFTVNYPRVNVQKLQKIEGYSELLQRQNIIEECINQLKRQIYYRNLSVGQRETKLHFNETSQVKFESFTKTDKKELIIKLLSNERVLNEFYQFLFNNNTTKNSDIQIMGATQLINNKLDLNSSQGLNNKWSLNKLRLSDARSNTQQLHNLKTQFDKKIFDIKHNR